MFNQKKTDFLLALISNFIGNKSILIIDDEIEVQRLMANYLIKSKVNEQIIVFASNGVEALEKLKNGKIGFMIIDLSMPLMNGMELIHEIKNTSQYKEIPIVISSGNLNNENVKNAVLHGVRDILVKPFNYDLFVDRICRALSS